MDALRRAGPAAAVVALKAGSRAKTRMRALPDDVRRDLAWAMALDTLTALADPVDHILVVGAGDRRQDLQRAGLDVEIIDDPATPGLNAALFHAITFPSVGVWDAEEMRKLPPPPSVRLSAAASLLIWIGVIACGRLLAYF